MTGTPRRPTIGILLPALESGGAERLVFDLLRTWRRDAPGDFVLFVLRAGGSRQAATAELGWPIVSLDESCRFDLRVVGRLVAEIRSRGVELLHAHLPRPGFFGRLACSMARIPSVYTEHNLWTGYPWPSRLANRWTVARHDLIVAVSMAVKKCIIAAHPLLAPRVEVVPNGVDVGGLSDLRPDREAIYAEFGFAPGDRLIVNVANLHRRKDHATLLRAHRRLVDRAGDIRLLVVGRDDGEGSRLRAMTESLHLDGSVAFAGRRDDAQALIAAGDVFALSSRVEGLPVALLEACALARPCVATRVGGIPEVVSDGERGWLVPPGDDVALADALESALNDRETACQRGRAAREWVAEHHSLRGMAQSYAAVYGKLLA